MAIQLVEQPATHRHQQVVFWLCVLVLLAAALIVPIADIPGPVMPHVAGVYGAIAAALHFATFWLLSGTYRPAPAQRIIAAAYLYAGLMAVLHVLTFPGALWKDQPIVGNPNTVSWLFFAWRGGFPLFILWAALNHRAEASQRKDNESLAADLHAPLAPLPHASPRTSAAFTALVSTAILYGISQLFTLPSYFPAPGSARYTTVSMVLSQLTVVTIAVTVIVVWRARLLERSLYLWLVPVLVVEAAGMVMSAFSGGRYSLGWYCARIEGVLSSLMLLAVLSAHLRQLQFSLTEAVDALRRRTEALQAEIHRRERAERMLLQSQKLEAVGQLAAGLAHDFNNIMQLISARMELIRRRVGAAVDADVEVMRRNIWRAEGLTRQLMSFSGRRQLQPQAVLLQRMLPELTTMFTPLLRSDISLEVDLPQDLWPVRLDPAELEVALANLLTNARDAMPNGGAVAIRGRNERGYSQDAVALSVADEGAGIDSTSLERVFEPFFTTKESGKGTGLGLSQVHAFVKGSGGSITIDSAVSRGTAVTLRFPRTQMPVQVQSAAPERAGDRVEERGSLVLLVDDNDDVREASALLLEQAGFAVRSASNGTHAMDMLQQGLKPEVLVTDVVMPGNVDGLALALRVREMFPDIRIVLVSGYSEAADKARASGLHILCKPYETAELLAMLAGPLARTRPASGDGDSAVIGTRH